MSNFTEAVINKCQQIHNFRKTITYICLDMRVNIFYANIFLSTFTQSCKPLEKVFQLLKLGHQNLWRNAGLSGMGNVPLPTLVLRLVLKKLSTWKCTCIFMPPLKKYVYRFMFPCTFCPTYMTLKFFVKAKIDTLPLHKSRLPAIPAPKNQA